MEIEPTHLEQLDKYSVRCIKPGTPWNYALKLEKTEDVRVEEDFACANDRPWDSVNAPICLYVKGRRLNCWNVSNNDNTIEPLPKSPVESDEPEEDLKLIPMGCARLRICCFPVLVSPERGKWENN